MPNLKKPYGLYIKKGKWNRFCTDCKRRIVRENITEKIEVVLCEKCKDVYVGKRLKGRLGYKIRIKCRRCNTIFDSKSMLAFYCDSCRGGSN